MGERARAFEARLRARYQIVTAYRTAGRLRSIASFLRFLRRERPAVMYVFDASYSGVIAACLYKILAGGRIVLDTGDAIFELARSAGLRGPVGLALTWVLERMAFRFADHVVVRGTYHQTLLEPMGIPTTVIQDGIDPQSFSLPDPAPLRARLRLEGYLSVGVLGSLVWSERLQMGYGWDLIEALRLLKGERIRGVLIGSGTGQAILRRRAEEYGLGDQITFIDRVPFDDVPAYLAAVDVWLSTQTNDIPGKVRTTGKLPLYMAAGRYILASDVGEAALVLPPEMRVRYDGVVDADYPGRLAARLRELAASPARLGAGAENVAVARRTFDYDLLAKRLETVFDALG